MTKDASNSNDAIIIPEYVENVLLIICFLIPITPKTIEIIPEIGITGISSQIKTMNNHHAAPQSLSETCPLEIARQKMNPNNKINIGAIAKIKLAFV